VFEAPLKKSQQFGEKNQIANESIKILEKIFSLPLSASFLARIRNET